MLFRISFALSVFQRQAHLTAGTVIDAENLPHMTVGRAAGVLLRQLGDGLGVCPCQLLHQALPAVLALVYGDEAGHTPDYTGKVGIHIALPRLVDDVKHLDVALTAILLVQLVCRSDAVDDGKFWMFSEGGRKFIGLEKNSHVCLAIYDKYDGFGNLRSLQVTGIAAMVEPFSEEYNTHAAFKKIPLDALKKLPSPMNLICVTPTRIDALFSDFKKDGYSSRQVLHQLA